MSKTCLQVLRLQCYLHTPKPRFSRFVFSPRDIRVHPSSFKLKHYDITPSPQNALVEIRLDNKINPSRAVLVTKRTRRTFFFCFWFLPLPYNFVLTMLWLIWDISGMYMLIPVVATGIQQDDSRRRRCTNPFLEMGAAVLS